MKIRFSAIFAILIMAAVLISAVSAVDFIEDSNSTDLQTGNVENLEIKTSDYDYDDTSNNPIKTVLNTDNSDTQADAQSNHVKYVRPDGTDDGGYGTSDNPYKTIKYAVSQSDENDTIFIYEGRYDENSISLTKSLNFVGENKNVIVTSSLNSRNVFESPYKENGNHISLKFENLTFDLIKPGQFNAILYLRNDDRNEIVDCVFTNNDGQYGIWSAAGETVISNCEFRDNTYTSAGNIIYLSGKGFQNLTNVTFDKTSNVGNGVLSLVYVINRPNRVHAENITIEESSGILYGFNIGNNGYGDVNNTLTVKNAKILAENYPEIRMLYDVTPEELANIKDIGPILASSVYNYFQNSENRELIEKLIDLGINTKYLGSSSKYDEEVTAKKIVITGTLSVASRPFIKEVLESYGAIVVESVSKKTDIVFVGEDPGSKYDKAKELGIKIYNDEKVTELINKLKGE